MSDPAPSGDLCPVPEQQSPHDDVLAELLGHVESMAIVGASPNPERTSHQITAWLIARTPYQLFLVNPVAVGEEIRGHGFYPSLQDLPVTPHLVVVFRKPDDVPAVAAQAIEIGAVGLWLQTGIVHEGAAAAATAAGLTVVQDRCVKATYSRLREQIEEHRATQGHS